MQIVIAIPRYEQLQDFGGAEEALLRDVSGVPLLIRVLATGIRAGGDSAVIVHREAVPSEVLKALQSSKILGGLRTLECVEAPHFEPASPTSWQRISGFLESEFLWLPWNWVTNKHTLTDLRSIEARPMSWDRPMRLKRAAVLSFVRPRQALSIVSEGTAITLPGSVSNAERWLVAHSGKPLDGIYSRFNRWLCRPMVRALAHTAVSPNMVTFAGLLVAAVSAYSFAQGNYAASLTGALLFFLSGLLDEVDGMLARVRFSDSAFGTWLEGTVDNLTYLLLFVGITIGLYRQRGLQEVLFGEAALFGSVLAVLVISWQRKRSTRPDKPHEYLGNVYQLLDRDRGNWVSRAVREVHIFLKKGVFIHYVVAFTALGLLPALLRLVAFASNLTWVLALYFSYRFFRRSTAGARTMEFSKAA
jgi:phosphatidylglycerophosphate synthase